MQIISIEILDPKAKKLLQNLADQKLISFKNSDISMDNLKSLLEELRKQASSAPSIDEITKEVEIVRRKRYGR